VSPTTQTGFAGLEFARSVTTMGLSVNGAVYRPIASPMEVLRRCSESAATFLETVRQVAVEPDDEKRLRTWGIKEAAALIGRSPQWIRDSEANDPRFTAPPLGPIDRDAASNRYYTLARINAYRDLYGTRKRKPEGARSVRCAVTNFKGGAGKTTTAVHLAQKCALHGYRVLMVDLDPQATTTLLFGIKADLEIDPEQTIGGVLVENPGTLSSVIRPTYFTGLDLVPANLGLQDAELLLANPNSNLAREIGLNAVERLRYALESVEDDYDVVVMDCGPNLGMLTLNAIHAATGMLIPMQAMMPDFGSAILYMESMASLMANPRFAHPLEFLQVLITRHTGSAEARKAEAMIRHSFDPHVLTPYTLQTVELERASNDIGTIYDIQKTRGSPEAYKRALASFDEVNNAMIAVFEACWAAQATRREVVNG